MIFNNRTWLSWNQQASVHLLYLTLQAGRNDLSDYFGCSWPLTILYYEKDQVYWLNRWDELRSLGFKMLDCLLLPGYKKYFYDEAFCDKSREVERAVGDLRGERLWSYSNDELIREYNLFIALYKNWYALGWYAEPVQFCAEAIMEDELGRIRDAGKIDAKELAGAKLYLYSSTESTYAAEIEDSLVLCTITLFKSMVSSKIVAKFYDSDPNALCVTGLKEDTQKVTSMTLNEFYQQIVCAMPDFEEASKAIKDHSIRYFWKKNNYYSTQTVSPVDVLRECLLLTAQHQIDGLESMVGASARRIGEYNSICDRIYYELQPYYRDIVDILSSNSKMKDSRKKTISLANHAVDMFLTEIARRTKYKVAEVRCLLPEELAEFLNNPDSMREELESRLGMTVIFWGEQDTAPTAFTSNPAVRSSEGFSASLSPSGWTMSEGLIASGETAQHFIRDLNDKFMFMLDWGKGKDLNSISGECAYSRPGEDKIDGVVRIIRDPKAASDFQVGDILVAPSTTPDYVPLMKQAKCIVTDWGGWTSHAALCARELGIPCIIGTYHASQVLSSGEEVTIRVREGIIVRSNARRAK